MCIVVEHSYRSARLNILANIDLTLSLGVCLTMKPTSIALFFLASMLIAVFQTPPAFANVPTVTGVIAWTRQSDNHTILNITVVHTGYFPGHFVNWVKVNISNTVQTISMTDSSPVDQTSSSTFVVPYDMGVISDTPPVQAQANCIIHGSSSWSTVLTVPELSSLQLVLILTVLTITVLLLKHRRPRRLLKALATSRFSNR
jgi:desulfoferrodoxin (superoxide reductase-like protein)